MVSSVFRRIEGNVGSGPYVCACTGQRRRARPKASLELGCISASGHWRQSTSALPWSALPSTMDIAAIAFTVRKVPTSDTSAGNVLSGCKLIHIPQSATAVCFDPISRRFRSHFEAARCSQPGRSRTADCSETQTLIFEQQACPAANQPRGPCSEGIVGLHWHAQ